MLEPKIWRQRLDCLTYLLLIKQSVLIPDINTLVLKVEGVVLWIIKDCAFSHLSSDVAGNRLRHETTLSRDIYNSMILRSINASL